MISYYFRNVIVVAVLKGDRPSCKGGLYPIGQEEIKRELNTCVFFNLKKKGRMLTLLNFDPCLESKGYTWMMYK